MKQELSANTTLSHYRIVSKLGAGGMGEVYLAQDERLGRKVALKLLLAGLATDEEARRRFIQKARAASALNHPHIITINDIGTHGDRDFITMEYVEGESLHGLMARERADIKRVLELIAQAGSGLAAAHEAGIIHRDIKPENLMVTRGGQLKILDFGLAKLGERHGASIHSSDLTTARMTESFIARWPYHLRPQFRLSFCPVESLLLYIAFYYKAYLPIFYYGIMQSRLTIENEISWLLISYRRR